MTVSTYLKLKFNRIFRLYKYRFYAKIQGKTIVHFLHIGKTGGISIKFALKNKNYPIVNEKYIIISHHHSFTIKNVRKGEKCFFFIRDPIDKFISGFYSRKKKGMLKNYDPLSKKEKKAFQSFKTPNELALSLSSNDDNIRKNAIMAMKNIIHVNSSYWDWFINEKYFISRINDIILVGKQNKLNEDFEKLKQKLKLPKDLKLPDDKVHMRKTSQNFEKNLDSNSIKNLRRWYSADFQFLKLLEYYNLI